MSILCNKNIIQKIAIILIVLLVINFVMPNFVHAESFLKEAGGAILSPIMDLLVFLSDSVLNILQKTFISPHNVVVEATSLDKDIGSKADLATALKIALGAILVIVAVATIIVSGGTAAAGWAAAAGAVAKVAVVGTAVKTIGGGVLIATLGTASIIWGAHDIAMDSNFDLPTIRYTPFEIFSGQVPILDINFLSPKEAITEQIKTKEEATTFVLQDYINENLADSGAEISESSEEYKNFQKATKVEGVEIQDSILQEMLQKTIISYEIRENDKKAYVKVKYKYYTVDGMSYDKDAIYVLDKPLEEILDEEAINNAQYKTYESSSSILQKTISTWYKALRRLALVGLLSVIVYVGIRIILSSTSADKKAKYKQMIVDWVAAVCILYVLHFLMVFIIFTASEISTLFVGQGYENILIGLPKGTKVLERSIDANGNEHLSNTEIAYDEATGKQLWSASLTGYIRYQCGVADKLDKIAYCLIYVVLVIYTVMFTFIYLKRVLYMAFLTMIAPLIALTYPIDKIKDSKAQAFSLWLKEYIFNALLQPIHLIIYIMVISTAMSLVMDYPIYALVALGFMVPAEKFIRKMFGLEKAETVSALGAATGATLAMGAIQKLGAYNKRHKKDKEDKKEENATIREFKLPSTATAVPDSSSAPVSTGGVSTAISSGGGSALPSSGGRTPISSGVGTAPTSSTIARTYGSAGSTKPPITSLGNVPGKNIFSGLKAIGGKYSRELEKAKPLRALARTSGKVLGATALGAAALPFGIASGSLSTTGKAVAAGGTLGSGFGGNIASDLYADGAENKEAFISGVKGEDAYIQQGVKDSKAIKKARELGMGPEVAGLSYKLVEELKKNKKVLYDDTKLKQVISSVTSDSHISDIIYEYVKAFR